MLIEQLRQPPPAVYKWSLVQFDNLDLSKYVSMSKRLAKEKHMKQTNEAQNKALALEAFDTLFNKRDYQAAENFWAPQYIQHSSHVPPGRDGLFSLVKSMPPELHYENARAAVDGNHVFLHGRLSGNGQPRALIVIDVLKIEDGVFVEHWDVLQSEVTKDESKSDHPMFGKAFAQPDPVAPVTAPSLTVEEAREIVAPLYEALNQPAKKDVGALLVRAANPDYRSFHTNEEFLTRDQLAEVFRGIGFAVPDLRWTIEDNQTHGDQIVVRGKATGTPREDFWGAKPTGKSFVAMAIDIFTVKNGKLASAYHVENWMTALQQFAK